MLRYYASGNWNVTTPCKKLGGTGALSCIGDFFHHS
jgi:hypothetical protein